MNDSTTPESEDIHTVDNPVETPFHPVILVTGSPDWDNPEAVMRDLVNWWAKTGEPSFPLLVADHSPAGHAAIQQWQSQDFPFVLVPDSGDVTENLERVVAQFHPTYGFVYEIGVDAWHYFAVRFSEQAHVTLTTKSDDLS